MTTRLTATVAIGAVAALTAWPLLEAPPAAPALTPADYLPAAATPGATNPKITAATMRQTICRKGWSTKSIRPTDDYTETLKKRQLAAPRYHDKNPAHYEEDHLISLELGGHPMDADNLWPEPYAGKCGARTKDKLEDKLHSLVCAGTVPLATAQHEIASNWIAAYNRYIGPLHCP